MATRYTFTVRATDSSVPPQIIEREFTLDVDIRAFLALGFNRSETDGLNLDIRSTPLFSIAAQPALNVIPKFANFNLQGTRLAFGVPDGIRILDTTSWSYLTTPSIVADDHPAVAYNPAGDRLLVRYKNGGEHHLNVYNASTNALVNTKLLDNGEGWDGEVAYSPNGLYYAANFVDTVVEGESPQTVLYNASTHNTVGASPLIPDRTGPMHFSPDSAFLAVGHVGGFSVFSVPAMTPLPVPALGTRAQALRFSPDGNYLAVTTDRETFVFDFSPSWGIMFSSRNRGNALSWSPDGTRLAIPTAAQPWVRMVNTDNWAFIPINEQNLNARAPISTMAFSPVIS